MAQQFRGVQSAAGGRNDKSRGKRKQRKLSKKRRVMYRRRRIVALAMLLVVIALVSFCAYSLVRGAMAVNNAIHHDDLFALERDAVPAVTAVKPSSVKDCAADDMTLQLTPAAQSVGVGGSLEFKQLLVYNGSEKSGCLADVSSSNLVLTITSGNETIYRSDVCPADSKTLLFSPAEKKDSRSITWNTDANASLTKCTDEQSWPRVNPGTYVAQLKAKDHPKLKSDPVTFVVQ